jgi:signal transduction histidine kinase
MAPTRSDAREARRRWRLWPWSSLLFALLVAFCLLQIGWWTFYQWQQTGLIEAAAAHLAAGRAGDAAAALGGDPAEPLGEIARRRRVMFVSEAAAFAAVLLLGAAMFAAAARREAAMRRNRDRFLAGAAHELKTPLSTLRLGIDSLADGRLPAERRDAYLRTMRLECERMQQAVANVLASAGARDAGRRLLLEPADLAADVREAAAAFAQRCADAGVELRVSAATADRVARDQVAMQLALHNLLDNALRHCTAGDAVTIAVRSDSRHAEVSIEDSGAGMSEDELQAVRDVLRNRAAPRVGNVGLGLHLVRDLMAAHGGSVEAASRGRGTGSEFVVRLPLSPSGEGRQRVG